MLNIEMIEQIKNVRDELDSMITNKMFEDEPNLSDIHDLEVYKGLLSIVLKAEGVK